MEGGSTPGINLLVEFVIPEGHPGAPNHRFIPGLYGVAHTPQKTRPASLAEMPGRRLRRASPTAGIHPSRSSPPRGRIGLGSSKVGNAGPTKDDVRTGATSAFSERQWGLVANPVIRATTHMRLLRGLSPGRTRKTDPASSMIGEEIGGEDPRGGGRGAGPGLHRQEKTSASRWSPTWRVQPRPRGQGPMGPRPGRESSPVTPARAKAKKGKRAHEKGGASAWAQGPPGGHGPCSSVRSLREPMGPPRVPRRPPRRGPPAVGLP